MYDYIVIGGGSSGCAVAGRLAENPETRVCVLEAGPTDRHFSVWVPTGCAATLPRKNSRNYGYCTVPQAGLNGRSGYQPRGRGLGGSSSLNAQIYMRGHRSDYDHWAAQGCEGWSWNDVLPYFIKSERNERLGAPLHGTNGPLNVADLRTGNLFGEMFIQSAMAAGYRRNDDFNGADQEGVGMYQVTQKNGERWNAARAYLYRSGWELGKPNLEVRTDAIVQRIVFEGKRAIGVEVLRGGTMEVLRAQREVVLAAGAFNSPQILMASGIGPAQHLQEMGIPVLHDLPGVGENLQDHLDVLLHRKVRSLDLIGYSVSGSFKMTMEIARYMRQRKGLLASNFAEAGAFLRSDSSLEVPDLQFHFVIALADNHNRNLHYGHGYSVHVCVLRPKSRGNVRLASRDVRAAPLIDPKFLSHPDDLAGMVRGYKVARRIVGQQPLSNLKGKPLYDGHLKGDGSDDAAVAEYIRNRADTIYHPVGTCKMGTDAMAVVDPQMRVFGVAGLRVVDASIMPTLIGGNTNAPAIMFGERAADFMMSVREVESPKSMPAAA